MFPFLVPLLIAGTKIVVTETLKEKVIKEVTIAVAKEVVKNSLKKNDKEN